MQRAEMDRELGRISYKPGWTFKVYDHPHEGPWIYIQATVPDSYGQGTVDLGVRTAIPSGALHTPPQLHDWVLERVKRMEIHECCEFFKVDGKPLHDPHAADAARG